MSNGHSRPPSPNPPCTTAATSRDGPHQTPYHTRSNSQSAHSAPITPRGDATIGVDTTIAGAAERLQAEHHHGQQNGGSEKQDEAKPDGTTKGDAAS